MRISSIIHMASEYLLLGIGSVSIGISIFLIIYFLIYKKIMKGTKKLNTSKVLLWSIFLIYTVMVLGATFVHRIPGMYENINLHMFSSYIKVWNRFSLLELRNLILNILMFVPFGVMLPLLFKKCEKFYITYFLGLCMTILIEVLQLISKRGIFEIDDIINNTLGCMIGYGIVIIFLLFSKRNKGSLKSKILTLLCYQIPVIITIVSFSTIFINRGYSNINRFF